MTGLSPWSLCNTLLEEVNRVGPDGIPLAILDAVRKEVGAVGVRLWFADVEERLLLVWGEAGDVAQSGHRAMIDGSVHGRVYVTGETGRAEMSPHHAVIAPVVARSERIGVIEVRFAEEPIGYAEDVAAVTGLVLGYVAVAAERWTDEFHAGRRRQDMTLAAELQWNLLPLGAFSTNRIAVAGALEPAYDIAGDCFDYSCGTQTFSAAIFDAMGHGVAAARLTDLAMAALRNARRSGKGLEAQALFVHESVAAHSGPAEFVTGQLMTLDLNDPARTRIVNAGHPRPYLQRKGGPEEVHLDADYPFGIAFPNTPKAQSLSLQPGDRLTLISDGVIEARPDEGEPFGEDRLREQLRGHRDFPPREAARRIIAEVRAHRAGDLLDDATIVMIDIPAP